MAAWLRHSSSRSMMALQFDVDISVAEKVSQPLGRLLRAADFAILRQRSSHGPSSPPVRQTSPEDYSQIFECRCAFSLGGLAHLETSDELAEILIAGARGAEQGKRGGFRSMLVRQPGWRRETIAQAGDGDFRAYMGAHTLLFSRGMKPRRTIDAVAVQERHRRHVELGSPLDQVFGQRGAFQES